MRSAGIIGFQVGNGCSPVAPLVMEPGDEPVVLQFGDDDALENRSPLPVNYPYSLQPLFPRALYEVQEERFRILRVKGVQVKLIVQLNFMYIVPAAHFIVLKAGR